MNDNPLFQALRELCLFLDNSGLRYTLVGGPAVGRNAGRTLMNVLRGEMRG